VFSIAGRCGVPTTAKALSVNATVVSPGAMGSLTLYRNDLTSAPDASTISFAAGRTRANNAILELSHDATQSFKVFNASSGAAHYVMDVNGYFK
jgi:hypothetical protein